MRVCVNVYYVLTSGFHVFFGGYVISHGDGFNEYIFVLVLEAERSRCMSAWGGLFGMQRGALETFDAFLREVLIAVPETWTRGAPLNAWT